jgi:hypothetical protein
VLGFVAVRTRGGGDDAAALEIVGIGGLDRMAPTLTRRLLPCGGGRGVTAMALERDGRRPCGAVLAMMSMVVVPCMAGGGGGFGECCAWCAGRELRARD